MSSRPRASTDEAVGGGGAGPDRPRAAPRWRLPVFVLCAMVAAFGIGVFIASRSELFPPQVEGGSPSGGAPMPSPPAEQRWRGRIATDSRQEYSAGPCTTEWRSSVDLVVGGAGRVRGTGRSRLLGRPRCPFPTSQPQIEGYDFDVDGRFEATTGFRLSLSHFRATQGIFDYGGFALTLAETTSTLEISVHGDRGRGRLESRSVTNLGKVVRATSVARIACRTCSSA